MKNLKVDFFIVGAPKAGTTALHAHLAKHPQVCMSSDKEPNYFSFEEIEKQQLYYHKENVKSESDYNALFECEESAKLRGEASVSYLFYKEVPQRIKSYNPNAKIIISLRQPVQRAYSHFQMDYSLGLVNVSFEEIYRNGPNHPATGNYFQQYFLLSDYADQVERYQLQFPHQQICILLHEDLIRDPDKTMKKVFHFLGIGKEVGPIELEKQNVSGAGKNVLIRILYQNKYFRKVSSYLFSENIRNKIKSQLFSKENIPSLKDPLAVELQHYYRAGLVKLKEQTGLSIDHWLKSATTK
jgi:Sulfotransferase domain